MRSPTTTRRPSWLRGVATAAFLVTVPSALWRVLMITGVLPGTAELRSYELGDRPAAGYAYVFGLSAVQLATGFLVTGLARPWGERVLGRRVPVTPPVVAGLAGGSAVTYLFDVSMVGQLAQGVRPDQGLVSGAPLALMVACYLPILAWGPLTLLATLG
ncbi:hypothetical protein FHX74_001191 [Friedmanniella endophytica]|uniref:Uncharacterized protein n=1 Tax=Microlunatus kandeliicorticis TaxID=1759536 RepID=A0A7W3IQW2_9ACTN|nr:hypothetical protein [Microlunatus kandeliicorticis]MBA8793586.1 hypothetical protein [Microlunatus kandeliicorticis]